jgi:homoserine O-succinyltransferase
MPVSRHTEVLEGDLAGVAGVKILSHSPLVGVGLAVDESHRYIYMFNHLEYDVDTLGLEYERDRKLGKEVALPLNYYPQNNPLNKPSHQWRAHAHLLFGNWLNDIYQTTPFDIAKIPEPFRDKGL